ncbi:hypothetical protein ACJZ2D_001885 [Fusarium nematophilum]
MSIKPVAPAHNFKISLLRFALISVSGRGRDMEARLTPRKTIKPLMTKWQLPSMESLPNVTGQGLDPSSCLLPARRRVGTAPFWSMIQAVFHHSVKQPKGVTSHRFSGTPKAGILP